MLAAHMDEIGIVVSHVDEKGFLRFSNIGGVRPLNLNGSRVRFADGTVGVIGLEKLEEPGKVPGLERFYLDIGAKDKASVRVKVGDTACFFRPFEEVGGRLVSKAMDDRVGCAVLLQVLRDLESSPHDVHFVFTVQEEVGLRGATTSGFGVDPEIALAVDVTGTGDTPECFPMAMHLGKGPAIKVRDSGMLAHVGVKDWLVRTAESAGIPYQLEVLDARHHRRQGHPDVAGGGSHGVRVGAHPLRPLAVGDGGPRRRAQCRAPARRGALGADRDRLSVRRGPGPR